MIRAIVISLVLMAGPAVALTPAAPCLVDAGSQKILMPETYAEAMSAGSAEFGEIFDVFPAPRPNGFVDWQWRDARGHWIVLHHCKTDMYMLSVARPSRAGQVHDLYVEMVESETSHTMSQMRLALQARGATARIGQGDIGRCDCVVSGMAE